ncbi:Bifunctional ligase/repressor BirA [Aquicella siphonis]|uniref:Bifunctional ligase/repressor BirA n=1 Tax=Aquicella siphonis TaxID=254247 RepID=A0A5E4PIC6_9COXI|nr:biotin--[acetyl-CoA-carboxylase] ligase [Aquicella siphonis]VVC76799.1 Bifunctional ligase/repressor BirA [Aquicella siphonis]
MNKKNNKLNANLVRLVHILSDGEYHDGTSMGEQLKMTRSAVWKAIKKLENFGVKIESAKGRGYALLEPLALLDINKIKKNISRAKIEFMLFESVDSTNEYLKTFKKSRSIKICLAERQVHGKGRMNREWFSPFGKNIYLSCLYPFQKDISELSGLSLVMSLAVIKTLKNLGIKDHLFVKWPNDIIYEHKKLSGSLIEIQAETHGACQAVIGIGINVNMQDDEDGRISQSWTSLRKIIGAYVDRNDLCAKLIDNLLDYLRRFGNEGLLPFLEEWRHADYLRDRMILVRNVNESIEGKVTGINEQGHLLLQMKNGVARAFSSGDTSVVKK